MSDDNKPPLPEDIEQHLAEIDDIDSFVTHQSVFEAFIPIVAARKTELGS